MVQIKITPEMLEEVANRASNTRNTLESIHNNLCNQIDHLCYQWIGASNQNSVQMFNDAKPKAFTSINSIVQVEEDLKRIAEKFHNADNQDVILEEDTTISKPSSGEEFDGGKLARDVAGELTGEYDLRRVWEGVDPSTGDKLSWLDRVGAGGMMVLGVTPVGKLAKLAKGAKMTVKATRKLTPAERAAKKGFPDIKTSPNGGPDFKDTPYLYPTKEGQRNIVPIEMTGNRQKDFKEHYLTYNGGEPERYVFVDEDGEEYIVTQFIPIKYDEESGRNLEYCLDTLRVGKVLPDWLIPFADETGGDLYCFSLKEGEEGSIYYWSHEYEFGEDPEEHVFYLTNSLKTFIDSMVEDE
ncbi:WXG100 family type VII secretion target [Bacillus clarus]|uniref:Secretion target family protein n=1 Tax=Bacillus clarus TaxID=2338372 RepID=A0A090YUB5_9BACI|nr:WXG100 family type VII secretion target [Bacillus clarus]KFN02010.1 secretion target family protein [Bacillus clarus]RFT62124.1 WXG100 family type VII secretion target [Bacillus clarus]